MPVDNFEEANKIYEKTGTWKSTNQNLDNWLKKFEKDIKPWIAEEEVVVITHSLAPLFVLHLVEKLDIKFKAAIFVSPFFERIPIEGPYDIVNSTFYNTDFNWDKIIRNIKKSFVFYSDNDPFIDRKYFQNFIDKTKSIEYEIKDGGHLGEELEEFPEVLTVLKKNNLI